MGRKGRFQTKINMSDLTAATKEALAKRGIALEDIAQIVYDLQSEYFDDLTLPYCKHSVEKVLSKREVCHAVLTGLAIDEVTEQGHMPEPIATIIKEDQGLYGIDEILPLSIVNIYGSIGFTNFGYLDKVKTGKIKDLDESKSEHVNTFADDIIAAIAAAAASRIAHHRRTA